MRFDDLKLMEEYDEFVLNEVNIPGVPPDAVKHGSPEFYERLRKKREEQRKEQKRQAKTLEAVNYFVDPEKTKILLSFYNREFVYTDFLGMVAPNEIEEDKDRKQDYDAATLFLTRYWAYKFYLPQMLAAAPIFDKQGYSLYKDVIKIQKELNKEGYLNSITVPDILISPMKFYKDIIKYVEESGEENISKIINKPYSEQSWLTKISGMKMTGNEDTRSEHSKELKEYKIYNNIMLMLLRTISSVNMYDSKIYYEVILPSVAKMTQPKNKLLDEIEKIISGMKGEVKKVIASMSHFLDAIFKSKLDIENYNNNLNNNYKERMFKKLLENKVYSIFDQTSYFPFIYIDDEIIERNPQLIKMIINIYSNYRMHAIYSVYGIKFNFVIISRKNNTVIVLADRYVRKPTIFKDSTSADFGDIIEHFNGSIQSISMTSNMYYAIPYSDFARLYSFAITRPKDYEKLYDLFDNKGNLLKDAFTTARFIQKSLRIK